MVRGTDVAILTADRIDFSKNIARVRRGFGRLHFGFGGVRPPGCWTGAKSWNRLGGQFPKETYGDDRLEYGKICAVSPCKR
jgi:hypothetical protein